MNKKLKRKIAKSRVSDPIFDHNPDIWPLEGDEYIDITAVAVRDADAAFEKYAKEFK